jgi:serine/threonine protein kinase
LVCFSHVNSLPHLIQYRFSRSVGCLVIELLEGKPPYHFLDPMPALFRIVQDDCPPIPEGASPIVKDFLYHCFQKDCNLRISAKKLLRHPWMVSARKQMTGGEKESGAQPGEVNGTGGERKPLGNYNFDEAVLRVQEWNEALRCEL